MPITTNEEAKNYFACHLAYWVRDLLSSMPNYFGRNLYKTAFFPICNVLYLFYMNMKEKVWPLFIFYSSFAILRTFAMTTQQN